MNTEGRGDIRISISSRNNWLEARMEAPAVDGGRGNYGHSARVENWSGTKREDLMAWIASTLNQFPPYAPKETAPERLKPVLIENNRLDAPGGETLDMEFVDLSLEEAESSHGNSGRVIEASGRLRVYSDAVDGSGAQPCFVVEFLLVNLDTGVTQTAALEQGDIQPGEWAREIRRTFPIPGKGRYQVRAVVKNAPAGVVLAESSGPTLRVVD